MGNISSSKQDIVKYLHTLGLKTFPLPHDRKAPPPERFYEVASLDTAFDPTHSNIGVSAGDGIVVLDFDGEAGVESFLNLSMDGLPSDTLIVATPSGGYHVYLSCPDGEFRNAVKRLPGVDIRGHHGYVVGPGSTVGGKPYTIVRAPESLKPIPPGIAAMFAARKAEPVEQTPLVDLDDPDNIKRAIEYLTRFAPMAVEGSNGSAATYQTAARLKDLGISEPTAVGLMLEHWNETKASPPWGPDEITTPIANAYRYATDEPPGSKTPQADTTPLPPEELARIEATRRAHALPPDSHAPARMRYAELFRPWRQINLAAIPYPEALYSDAYIRGYLTVTAAAPKVGKSFLSIAEAVDMVTGRGFLTGREREPLRVLYFNLEDDQDIIDSRVAACLEHYSIDQSEIEGRLSARSGVTSNFRLLDMDGSVNEDDFRLLGEFARDEKMDVMIFDPLQDLSSADETNEVFRTLGRRIRMFAQECQVAVGLVHHTRKLTPGAEATIDDMRGGSALRGVARVNRLLVRMTPAEAAKAGEDDHRNIFCIGEAESNFLPPPANGRRWFRRLSVRIPSGQSVGVVKKWEWPDPLGGVSDSDILRAVTAIAVSDRQHRRDPQAHEWVGHLIGEVLGIDSRSPAGKAKLKALTADWISRGYLKVVEQPSSRDRKPVKCVEVGDLDALQGFPGEN